MHSRREGVVRRLRLVYVVVRMNLFLLVHQVAAQQHVRTVSYHLVHVHVRLRAGTCLPYYQGELFVELTSQYLIANFADDVGLVLRQHP